MGTVQRKVKLMETQNQDKRPLKVLVIGSKGHSREVQSYNWTEIDRAPNIADQDAVIIDMTSLTESILEKIISSEWRVYFKEEYFVKLLASRGQVFVITVPTVEVIIEYTTYDNYWWSPFPLEFEKEKGVTIEKVSSKFQRYFNNVKYWNFTMDFDREADLVERLTKGFPDKKLIYKLAQTRYRAPIGIQVLLLALLAAFFISRTALPNFVSIQPSSLFFSLGSMTFAPNSRKVVQTIC